MIPTTTSAVIELRGVSAGPRFHEVEPKTVTARLRVRFSPASVELLTLPSEHLLPDILPVRARRRTRRFRGRCESQSVLCACRDLKRIKRQRDLSSNQSASLLVELQDLQKTGTSRPRFLVGKKRPLTHRIEKHRVCLPVSSNQRTHVIVPHVTTAASSLVDSQHERMQMVVQQKNSNQNLERVNFGCMSSRLDGEQRLRCEVARDERLQ